MALRCIVVTPERTQLDREAEYVSLPMFDGELGVLPGRAPMIGRLGHGTLRLQTAAGPERYYVDGGFVQVQENLVSVLTNRAMPVGDLSYETASEQLEVALGRVTSGVEQMAMRDRSIAQARAQMRLAARR